MANGVIVLVIAGKKHAETGLGAEIAAAKLIQLGDGGAGLFEFPQLEVGFGEQIVILWLTRMRFDLILKLCQVQLSALLRREGGAIVEVVEKMLKRVWTSGNVF